MRNLLSESGDTPSSFFVLHIGKAVAHVVDLLARAGMKRSTLLIHPYAVVFPCEVNKKCIEGRLHIVQPLFITFPYKCLAHKIQFDGYKLIFFFFTAFCCLLHKHPFAGFHGPVNGL